MECLAERLTYTVVVVTASIINNSTSLSFLICETEKKNHFTLLTMLS